MKRVLVAAVICILSVLLFSCSSSDGLLDEYKNMLESVSDKNGENEPEYFAEKVYVIVPEHCSSELSLKATELAGAIEHKTGVISVAKYDNESIYVGERDLCIFLGNTRYIRSKDAVKPLRHKDYLCRWDSDSIVLGGRHDEATVVAVDRFISEILHGASSGSLMHESAGFEYTVKYDVLEVTLNGYDLYDYTFVYSEKNLFGERRYAELFRDIIALKSGYYLNVIPDSEIDKTVGKTIVFEGDSRVEGSAVDLVEDDVFIKASNEYAFSNACAELVKMLFGNVVDREAQLEVSCKKFDLSSNELKISRAFSICDGNYGIGFIEDWSHKVHSAGSDIIIFDSVPEQFIDDIKREKGDYLLLTKTDREGNCYPLLYKNGVFESVSLEIEDSVIYVGAKCFGEKEPRRLICPTLESKADAGKLLEGCKNYDMLIFNRAFCGAPADFRVSSDKSWEWSLGEDDHSHSLVYTDVLTVEEERSELEISIDGNCINAFFGFSYRFNTCTELEILKESLK